MTLEKYISIRKDLIDHFLAIRYIISDLEQKLYMFRGLNSHYSFLVTNVTGKKRILSIDELFHSKCVHNRQQECMNAYDVSPIQDNYTKKN